MAAKQVCYFAGQSHAINLSAAAPKPPKIVLAQPRSSSIVPAPVTAVNLSKTGNVEREMVIANFSCVCCCAVIINFFRCPSTHAGASAEK